MDNMDFLPPTASSLARETYTPYIDNYVSADNKDDIC